MLSGTRKWKFDDMMLVTWPRWPPHPYMLKTLQNLLLLNRWTDFHETWYVAFETPAHHSLFKWWPWSDLDLFYGKIKFGNISFSIGKIEKKWIFLKLLKPVTWKVVANEGMEGQGNFWHWPQDIYIWKLKLVFLRNWWAILNQILYVSFQVQGNENPWPWCWSPDRDGHHAHIW